jgi:hypothetical protein
MLPRCMVSLVVTERRIIIVAVIVARVIRSLAYRVAGVRSLRRRGHALLTQLLVNSLVPSQKPLPHSGRTQYDQSDPNY